MPMVPTTRQVVPGALVNIVLKADQPTGRTVQGAVSQLLTRGNHPRGIKVRLTDGRVGRVQSMAGIGTATESQLQLVGSIEETPSGAEVLEHGPGQVGRRRRNGGWREPGEEKPPPSQAVGLDAYIKPAKKRGKASSSGNSAAESSTAESTLGWSDHAVRSQPEPDDSVCPVCGDFRGDVAALTHHVQSHFDD